MKMGQKFQKLILISSFIPSSLIAFSGCGANILSKQINNLGSTTIATNSVAYGTTPNPLSSTTPGSCNASQPNVFPSYDQYEDGTNRFTVCHDQSLSTVVDVLSFKADADIICVFPMFQSVTNLAVTYLSINDDTGNPIYACSQMVNNAASINFSSITFSYVYVVTGANASRLQQCLIDKITTGNEDFCPIYSSGPVQ